MAAPVNYFLDDQADIAALDAADFLVIWDAGTINPNTGKATVFKLPLSLLDARYPAAAVSSVFGRTGAVVAVAGDYLASQITNTPAGSIAAVTVQAAIDELDSEKQPLEATLVSD